MRVLLEPSSGRGDSSARLYSLGFLRTEELRECRGRRGLLSVRPNPRRGRKEDLEVMEL